CATSGWAHMTCRMCARRSHPLRAFRLALGLITPGLRAKYATGICGDSIAQSRRVSKAVEASIASKVAQAFRTALVPPLLAPALEEPSTREQIPRTAYNLASQVSRAPLLYLVGRPRRAELRVLALCSAA